MPRCHDCRRRPDGRPCYECAEREARESGDPLEARERRAAVTARTRIAATAKAKGIAEFEIFAKLADRDRLLSDRPSRRAGVVLDPEGLAGLDAAVARYYATPSKTDRVASAALRALAPGEVSRALALAKAWEV